VTVAAFLLLAASLAAAGQESAPGPHDRAYWRSIVASGYAVPEGESDFALARELSRLRGSPDAELRDTLAYSILANWVENPERFSNEELRALLDEWRSGLRSTSVLERSFSALCLASLAERDLGSPFLGDARYRELLAEALAGLRSERDLRGYETPTGWIHATAHTADLLKALSRNPLLTAEGQRAVLAAIGDRLASAPGVFTHGEQSRLARVAAAIVVRSDFDRPAFEAWLERLREEDRRNLRRRPLTEEALVSYENRTYMLEALAARLSMETLSADGTRARDAVLAILRNR
jgi:hypothetical protein